MPVRAVLVDFHGTVAQVEEPVGWVTRAAAARGVDLEPAAATTLAGALIAAGRAGGPLPAGVPEHLADVWKLRDLDLDAHRACYTGLAAQVESGIDGLPEALHDRLMTPGGWVLYADTVPVLRSLRAAGVRIALVSNIGFDLRPVCDGLGLGELLDAYALSYEIGAGKPDPRIFTAACDALGVAPADAVMIGDTPADAGAAAVGCRCLILPVSPPGAVHGLAAVLDLLGSER